MKTISIVLLAVLFFWSCSKEEVAPPQVYNCEFSFADSSASHPNAAIYQSILESNQKHGLIGVSVLIKDKYGVWSGAAGKADVEAGVDVQACQPFFIASISKAYTATCVYAYIDAGILSLDDPVNKWLAPSLIEKVENAGESQIKHLLSHTSGIPDYYTLGFDLDRMNAVHNGWTQADVLTYTYGQPAYNEVGEAYRYSNTNFVLLGMILEQASGLSLAEVYQEKIFDPLNLTSAYFGTTGSIPADIVKGYVDIYGEGEYVESEFLFRDELGLGDGGIAINAYECGLFFEQLMKGNLISAASLAQMTDWFPLPEGWEDPGFGHYQNGYGIQRMTSDYGTAVGHTGAINGFFTVAEYFPEQDATIVILVNCASYDLEPVENIYKESLKAMFE
ncbi:MAG: beta-lactamase family protein [Phaeodactylibacter sp.]|nr:beta-lactamase family protein [Phaeodactylibacter sp.]